MQRIGADRRCVTWRPGESKVEVRIVTPERGASAIRRRVDIWVRLHVSLHLCQMYCAG